MMMLAVILAIKRLSQANGFSEYDLRNAKLFLLYQNSFCYLSSLLTSPSFFQAHAAHTFLHTLLHTFKLGVEFLADP
jgi:indole-3-glycerol phosphate synthase